MAENIKFIYDDGRVFAVEKPSLVHSVLTKEGSKDALAGKLLAKFPRLKNAAPRAGDAGLVQRLDFETSGLILGAWKNSDWQMLRDSLAKSLEKEYLLVVAGKFPASRAIEGYVGPRSRGSKKLKFYSKPQKRALKTSTFFKLLTFDPDVERSLVLAQSSTGARHQIRVHAGELGFPLLGDTLYGGKTLGLPKDLPSFFLHALSLQIKIAGAAAKISLRSEPPEYLREFFPLGMPRAN